MSLFISENLVPCLGWTLLHFLWQGLVIAGGFALCARLLRSAPANQRYLAGCVALSAMIIAPLITLEHEARQFQPPAPVKFVQMAAPPEIAAAPIIDYVPASVPTAPPVVVHFKAATAPPPFVLTDHLDDLLAWLVIAWAVGVCALSSRLAVSWLHVKRLKHRATTVLAGEWPERLAELMRRLEVSRPVRLFQSALVEVPTVIGWLRPVILLPAGCLAGLSPAQLEAVLAHELAHVRRHDYLVNLVQSAVETLLFYHPAVWWISRRIREERELCCDDLAVRVCRDRVAYARALATLEELRLGTAQVAVAAGGAPLLERIRRLAAPPQKEVARSGWVLTLVLALTVVAAVALSLWSNGASAQGGSAPVGDDVRSRGRSQTPPDASDAPTIKPVVTAPPLGSSSGTTLTWQSVTGEQYKVQVTTNLSSWTMLTTVTATGPTTTFVDPTPLAIPSFHFYRIIPMPHPATTPGTTNDSDLAQIRVSPQRAKAPGATNFPAVDLQNGMNQATQPTSATIAASPQINIKAKFVEFNHGIDLAQFNLGMLTNINLDALYLSNTQTFVLDSTSTGNWTNAPGALTPPIAASIAGILTDPQFKIVLQALEQRPGVETLTAPEVTTESGRQVHMDAEDVQTVVTGLRTPSGDRIAQSSLPIGPQLEVIPSVPEDGLSIQLALLTTAIEFVGYDGPQRIQTEFQEGGVITAYLPRPRFRNLSFGSTATVPAGQTAVLLIPGGFRLTKVKGTASSSGSSSESMTKTRKDLLIFITPTLVNPDGTPYHSDEGTPRLKVSPAPAATPGTTNASALTADPRLTLDQRPAPGVRVTYEYGKPPVHTGLDESATPDGAKLPEYGTNKIAAMTLVQDARVLLEAGKWDEAEARLLRAGKLDPENLSVTHYLDLIQESRAADAVRSASQAPNNYMRTNLVSTSKGREKIKTKLNRIVIDSVKSDELPLSAVITLLSKASVDRDPDREGINFMFDHNPLNTGRINPATGLPLPAQPGDLDIGEIPIRIMPELRNLTLAQVLDAVVTSASTPIRYSIEDYAVMFALKVPETEQLFTRTFHIDPNTFMRALANAPVIKTGNAKTTGGLSVTNAAASTTNQQAALIDFFQAAGVDLSSNAVPPRSVFWNDRKGTLLIRASASELEMVAQAMEIMNEQPPLINIKCKFVELDEWDFPGHVFKPEAVGISNVTRMPLSGFSLPGFPAVFSAQLTNSITEAFSGGLIDPGLKAVLQTLEKQPGVKVLAGAEVTTESGRQAQLLAEEVTGVLTNKNSKAVAKLPFGPALDVLSECLFDGFRVRLTMTATQSRLLDKPDVVLPQMLFDQLKFTTNVWDAETLVMGGAEGPAPQAGGHRKWFLVFVTPTLINPDGTRLHSDDEMPRIKISPPTGPTATTNASSGQSNPNTIKPSPAAMLVQPNRASELMARENLKAKLERLRIDNPQSDGLPLRQVITSLNEQTRARDPDRQGVNFMFDHALPVARAGVVDPATGLPLPFPKADQDIGDVPIRNLPAWRDARLIDVLDAIKASAATPISYYLKDAAVVFVWQDAEPLFTRTFRVDPKIFAQALSNALAGMEFGAVSSSGGQNFRGGSGGGGGSIVARVSVTGANTSGGFGTNGGGPGVGGLHFTTTTAQANDLIRFFQAAGVDLGPTVTPPRSVFWSDRRGTVLVRASEAELDKVAKAVEVMNETSPKINSTGGNSTSATITVIRTNGSARLVTVNYLTTDGTAPAGTTNKPVAAAGSAGYQAMNETPPQINLKVKFVEVGQSESRAMGFNRILGSVDPVGAQTSFTNNSSAVNASGVFPTPPAPVANTASDRQLTSGLRNAINATNMASFTGILTDPQFKLVLRALEQRQGVEVLPVPEVTALSGRQVHVESSTNSPSGHSSGYTNQDGWHGPTPALDLIPRLSTDGRSIQLTVLTSVPTFLVHSDGEELVVQVSAGARVPVAPALPLPNFRVSALTNSLVVPDGQTLVMSIPNGVALMKGGVPQLGDMPGLEKFFRNAPGNNTTNKDLIIFITPTLINPDGSRFHGDEENAAPGR